MSSLALYRRYRPETFAEVVGQEHVTDPLQQALRNNRVNHAYLFSGPRGCGKTTSARILARCLNCEQGPTPAPCGECRSCRDLARDGPGSIDVIEIDAASHGGVDDARELREKAFFGPASSRYKIYIVDEAHMVTSAGFNALLKVVEEPPEHLKFIFATTEPDKVIGTIRSRTHHYPFRLVPPGTLRDHLAAVCAREEIQVDDAVLPLAVRAGAGSVRDSMSVMDQLLAGSGPHGVTYAMATALLGYTDSSLLDDVVDAFAAGDGAAAFEVIDRVIEGGHDPRRFVADLLERLRDLVILAAVPEALEKGLVDAPGEVIERMRAQASVFGPAELSRAADLVNSGLTEMRGATSPRLQLELICARVLLPATYGDERSVQARLDRLERGAAFGGGAPGGAPAAGQPPAQPQPAHSAQPGPAAPAPPPPGAGAPTDAPNSGPHPGGPAEGAGAAPAPESAAPGAPGAGAGAAPASSSAPAGGVDAGSAPAPRRPGAWPEGSGAPGSGAASPPGSPGSPGASGTPGPSGEGSGRAPGAWPGGTGPPGAMSSGAATSPGAASGQGVSPGQSGPPATPPSGPPAGQPGQGQPAGQDSQGAARVRQMWPDILEAVKNRRRFTWILLSQNAQVAGFDGTTLQLGFSNAGARDSFANSGSDEVLRQALSDSLGVQWQVEAIVDPSGGASAPAGGPAGGPPGGGAGFNSGPPQPSPGGSAPPAPAAGGYPGGGASTGVEGGAAGGSQPAAAHSGAAVHAPAQPGGDRGGEMSSARPAAASGAGPSAYGGDAEHGAPSAYPGPGPEVSLEEDMPSAEDADLDESALSGHDLIVRELGATVIEEFHHG